VGPTQWRRGHTLPHPGGVKTLRGLSVVLEPLGSELQHFITEVKTVPRATPLSRKWQLEAFAEGSGGEVRKKKGLHRHLHLHEVVVVVVVVTTGLLYLLLHLLVEVCLAHVGFRFLALHAGVARVHNGRRLCWRMSLRVRFGRSTATHIFTLHLQWADVLELLLDFGEARAD